MSRRHRAAGFTLVEVVVALVIGGLLTLTAAATVAAVPDLATRADDHLSSRLRAAAVRSQLREWLLASYADRDSTYDASFSGVDGPRAGTDALRFAVTGGIEGITGRATILLGIHRGPGDSSALVAEIEPERGARRRIVLVPGATSFEARYLYFVSTDGRWFQGWSSAVERPAAVRMWIDGESVSSLIRLPLTVWLDP